MKKIGKGRTIILTLCAVLLNSIAFVEPSFPAELYYYGGEFGQQGTENGEFSNPSGIVLDRSGNIYVADTGNERVQAFDSNGIFVDSWKGVGSPSGLGASHFSPIGIDIYEDDVVYISDAHNYHVSLYSIEGNPIDDWYAASSGSLGHSYNTVLAVDTKGNAYVAYPQCSWSFGACIEELYYEVTHFNPLGERIGSLSDDFDSPQGLVLDSKSNLYVADTGNHRIVKYASDGTFVREWGANGLSEGEFMSPRGLAVDTEDNVYVADSGNHRIQKFTADGVFITEFGEHGYGPGELNNPKDLDVGPDGAVFVCDSGNHRIEKFISASLANVFVDGIWKDVGETISFYVQTYTTGSAVVIATQDLILFYIFLDSNVGDGIDVPDLANEGHHLSVTFTDDTHATAYLNPSGSAQQSYAITKKYGLPSDLSNNGIWKTPSCNGGTMSYYVQTYDSGSAIVVGTPDLASIYVFLDSDYTDGIDAEELAGKPYHLSMSFDSGGSGESLERCVNAPIQGSSGSTAASCNFASTGAHLQRSPTPLE